MAYQQYISIDAERRFGQPCIVNTRISIADILSLVASGMSSEDIIDDFPELQLEHISAAFSFAAEREHSYRIAS